MKNNIIVLCLIIIIMLVFPMLTVEFIPSDAGMAACFIMFLVINPLFSAGLGVYSGFKLSKRWIYVIVSPIVYIISCWALFAIGDAAFSFYAYVYFVISAVGACVSAIIKYILYKSK